MFLSIYMLFITTGKQSKILATLLNHIKQIGHVVLKFKKVCQNRHEVSVMTLIR